MPVGNHTLPTELVRTCSDGMMSCMAQWAFDVTYGMFWTLALLGFCVVLFIATTGFGNKRAFGFASFVGLLGSVWFAIQGLIVWWIASAFILAGVIGLVIMIMDER